MKELLIIALGKPSGIVIYQLLDATQYTIYLSLLAFTGGALVAAAIAILRLVNMRWLQVIADGYIWTFQSIPLLMLLFLSGLGAPRFFGIEVDPWLAACLSLTLHASAFLADVWRGCIESIDKSQEEAARALGLGWPTTLIFVIAPQAMRVAIAPTVGFMVQIIKGTSMAYIIGFHDLMSIGKRWANASVPNTEPYIIFPIMALIYFSLCFPITLWSRSLEKRFGDSKESARPLAM